jgi:hypothetical protein
MNSLARAKVPTAKVPVRFTSLQLSFLAKHQITLMFPFCCGQGNEPKLVLFLWVMESQRMVVTLV